MHIALLFCSWSEECNVMYNTRAKNQWKVQEVLLFHKRVACKSSAHHYRSWEISDFEDHLGPGWGGEDSLTWPVLDVPLDRIWFLTFLSWKSLKKQDKSKALCNWQPLYAVYGAQPRNTIDQTKIHWKLETIMDINTCGPSTCIICINRDVHILSLLMKI